MDFDDEQVQHMNNFQQDCKLSSIKRQSHISQYVSFKNSSITSSFYFFFEEKRKRTLYYL
eukprot:c25762_g9_i2 orf=544-723(-)